MMLVALGSHILDVLGIVYIVRTAVKISRGKPATTWFW